MDHKQAIKFLLLRSIGNFLLLFSLFGVVATFGPVIYYEVNFHIIQLGGFHYSIRDTKIYPQKLSGILDKSKEEVLIPIDTYFDLLIPKIRANSKIFPNVDASNSNLFLPILQKGIAHARGSVFPGTTGTIYLFAHSTDSFWNVGRYNAVFYLLKNLTVGDEIILFFKNKRYNYKVQEIRIVDASDTSYLQNAQKYSHQQLILQTCWPPGTTWKRLLVISKPVLIP